MFMRLCLEGAGAAHLPSSLRRQLRYVLEMAAPPQCHTELGAEETFANHQGRTSARLREMPRLLATYG